MQQSRFRSSRFTAVGVVVRHVQLPQQPKLPHPRRRNAEVIPGQVEHLQVRQRCFQAGAGAGEPVAAEVKRLEGRRWEREVELERAPKPVVGEVEVVEHRRGPEDRGDGSEQIVAGEVDGAERGHAAEVRPRDGAGEVARRTGE